MQYTKVLEMCCLTVLRWIDSIVSNLPNYEESIGLYRSDNGVVTGKTAEKQDKCSLELSREHIPAFTLYSTGRLGARIAHRRGPCTRCLNRSPRSTRSSGSPY